MFKYFFLLSIFSSSLYAGTFIIKPHFGHTVTSEMKSNLFKKNKTNIQGITAGLKIAYRHEYLFYGVDLESSNFRVMSIDETDGFSSKKFSFLSGVSFNPHEVFGKVTAFGSANINNEGIFNDVVGFEVGYSYKVMVKDVPKLSLFCTYSTIGWSGYDTKTSGSDKTMDISRVHFGIGLPFEIKY